MVKWFAPLKDFLTTEHTEKNKTKASVSSVSSVVKKSFEVFFVDDNKV